MTDSHLCDIFLNLLSSVVLPYISYSVLTNLGDSFLASKGNTLKYILQSMEWSFWKTESFFWLGARAKFVNFCFSYKLSGTRIISSASL